MSIDLGFIGTLAQANAQKGATQAQTRAINKQREYLFKNLDPAVIGPMSLKADQERAKNQLALLAEINPSLAAAQKLGSEQILSELQKNGVQAQGVADEAVREATTGPQAIDAKTQLIDAAREQLALGAKLPPDVQAELVQAGLEQSGMATGRSSAQGMGGTMLRTILGQAGVKLQMERQAQANQLLAGASNLEAQRQQVLQTLFPNLSALQTQNMSRAQGAFATAQSATPQAGMSGTDVANMWLARVGSTNSLTQQMGNVNAQNALAQGAIMNNAMGGASININQAVDLYKKIAGTGSSTSYAGDAAYVTDAGTGGASYAPVGGEAGW